MTDTEIMNQIQTNEMLRPSVEIISAIVEEYGGLPSWLREVFSMVLANTDGEIEFDTDSGTGASILTEASEQLDWDYQDEGEYARLNLPNLGYTMELSREAIMTNGKSGSRAKLQSRKQRC